MGLRNGKGILIESSKLVTPWREAVIWASRQAMQHQLSSFPLSGATAVAITFTLRRPSSAPKRKLYPTTRPDLDKLARSTLDALVQAGVLKDDSIVTSMILHKVYPTQSPESLDVPGAKICICPETSTI